MSLDRRQFMKYGLGGVATLVVGGEIPWITENEAFAAVRVQTLNFRITDAMKEMVTHNAINDARCYFWVYKEDHFPAEVPGPNIITREGDVVQMVLTNDLDEPHAFSIPGVVKTPPLLPGQTRIFKFVAPKAGTYLYFDHLNAPVNRVMGLHGAFIVMPRSRQFIIRRDRRGRRRRVGQRLTPYSLPTPQVQKLFNELGHSAHYPGLDWETGDPATSTPRFRQYIWVLHQASPNLFQEVGSLPPGVLYDPNAFVQAFLRDPFSPTLGNRTPQYFTINGQSGHFAHNNPFICPNHRVGEPCVVRILNAGLWTHSTHIHANHVYVLAINRQVQKNVFWVDTWTSNPLDTYDWLVPYMRPPDVPNLLGIGLASPPLTGGIVPHPVWPPTEEINTFFPPIGTTAGGVLGGIPIHVQLSPLCFPMHDHSEPSQTSQGGNYNLGLISGINFIGDRNTPGGVTTFPNAPLLHGPEASGPAAGPEDAAM